MDYWIVFDQRKSKLSFRFDCELSAKKVARKTSTRITTDEVLCEKEIEKVFTSIKLLPVSIVLNTKSAFAETKRIFFEINQDASQESFNVDVLEVVWSSQKVFQSKDFED